ncbi:MAG: hypothetical protein J6M47_08515 [Clostridia bacterium]|nr:hypothetical protein [Clostridia bacterium]
MKTWIWMMALLMILALPVQGVLAEKTDAAAPYLPTEYTAEYEKAAAALQAHTPGAQVDYAVRERDDGRYEWDLFFTLGGQLGEAEIAESDYAVRRVRQVDMPEGGLTASQAMAVLAQEKGDITIIDLELERDDGSLRYEGEAELDGKRYEFEISVTGKIVEWKRD